MKVSDEVLFWIMDDLKAAQTPEYLEKVKSLAADAVKSGLLTQAEVDAIWRKYAPE